MQRTRLKDSETAIRKVSYPDASSRLRDAWPGTGKGVKPQIRGAWQDRAATRKPPRQGSRRPSVEPIARRTLCTEEGVGQGSSKCE
ncbi:hypothetical protein J1614_006662 [Plenodomus biglobosus]|nr:hypothetical protein J1614_006662 [Plenodomus biglobosus]